MVNIVATLLGLDDQKAPAKKAKKSKKKKTSKKAEKNPVFRVQKTLETYEEE